MKNTKYQKRLENAIAESKILKTEKTNCINEKNSKGDLTFQKLINNWTNSKDFKDVLIYEELFNMQWKLIRTLRAYLTEEEKRTIPLWKLESKIEKCINDFLGNTLDQEKEAFYFAFENFLDYINKIQLKYNNEPILEGLVKIIPGKTEQDYQLLEENLNMLNELIYSNLQLEDK